MSLKKIVTHLMSAISIAVVPALVATVAAVAVNAPMNVAVAYPDPIIPLLEPMPFPWDTIEGIWQAEVDGSQVLFSFDVRNDNGGHKFLHVAQVDATTNKVVAEGSGFVDPKSGAVQAGMSGKHGSYMLFVGQYRNDKLTQYPHVVTVLTARSFQSLTQSFSKMIEKVETQPIRSFSSR